MARVFTIGWELGHTGNDSTGTVFEADEAYRGGGGGVMTSTSYVRSGARSLEVSGNASTGAAWAAVVVPLTDEFWLRAGFRFEADNPNAGSCSVVEWQNAGGGEVGSLRMDSATRFLSLWKGGGQSALAAESSGVILAGHWHLLEVHWRTGAQGAAELKVDGNPLLSFAGDTDAGAGQAAKLKFGCIEKSGNAPGAYLLHFDDCAMDDAGWLGDGHVVLLRPDGNGASSQLTGSDGNGVNNYQLVDEAPASTADYVEGAAPGLRDTYSLAGCAAAGVPPGAEIAHVDVVALARTLAVGSDAMRGVVRVGGTDYASASQQLSGDWRTHRFPFHLNPGTAAQWTQGDLDGAEGGVQTA